MSAEEKYLRTVVVVEILSDRPVDTDSLPELLVHDDVSVTWTETTAERLDRGAMARALVAQGSDPGFLVSDWDEDL